jgi:hypothetical protein
MKIQVEDFWVATLCSAVVGYQRFLYHSITLRQNPEDLDFNNSFFV